MIPNRYPAPQAKDIFSDQTRFGHWKDITDAYAGRAIDSSMPGSPVRAGVLISKMVATNAPTPAMVGEFEQELGHDVVAFLAAYCTKLPSEIGEYIHDGLTSSDLVEFGLFQQIGDHASAMASLVNALDGILLTQWEAQSTIRAGRTHGQIADHTSWEHQMYVICASLRRIRAEMSDLAEDCNLVKFAGPTGWPGAMPAIHERGRVVADLLDCEYEIATQVISRDRLLAWAALYLRLSSSLENLALQIRLAARADVAEVREGAKRVGSSAMPHKHNPIDSEKVCGLARVARGYFMAISEDCALWEDRDLTNSSLERIAVPGLASTIEHMLITMVNVMNNLQVDHHRMHGNATDYRTRTNIMQVAAQRLFHLSPVDASALVRLGISKDPAFYDNWQHNVFETLKDRGYDAQAWDIEVDRMFRDRFLT
jgi:adenylosuccinate lyase